MLLLSLLNPCDQQRTVTWKCASKDGQIKQAALQPFRIIFKTQPALTAISADVSVSKVPAAERDHLLRLQLRRSPHGLNSCRAKACRTRGMFGVQSLDTPYSSVVNDFNSMPISQNGAALSDRFSGAVPSLLKDDTPATATELGSKSATEYSNMPTFASTSFNALGSSAYPGAVLQGRRLAHTTSLPAASTQPFGAFSNDANRTIQRVSSFPATTAQLGSLPNFTSQAAAPQPGHLQSLYATSSLPNVHSASAGLPSLPQSLSCGSGLSCATAKPQLSSDCQSTNNSEDSILHSINSSPCYQSSYSGSYLNNPFHGPPSPVSRTMDNAALLEQTAAMMKTAAAAIQNLQSSSLLYRPPQQQQPAAFTSTPMHSFPHACFTPQYSNAMQSASFPPVQPALSMPCIGMQALEELMMSDSSVDSSPIPALNSSPSAPACLLTIPQPASPCSAPAKIQTKRETKAATAQPQPAKPAVRSVTDIPVFNCKAAAAASAAAAAAAQHAQQAAQVEVDFAQQGQHAAADLADFDLPLIDDCFLDSVGSGMGADLDSDLASGLCFDGCYFEQMPFEQTAFEESLEAAFDRSDSSDNLAEQALVTKSPVSKRKPKQSKKLKARGGVHKTSLQGIRT